MFVLFSVEEDEPDEIVTTNNHHLQEGAYENNGDEIVTTNNPHLQAGAYENNGDDTAYSELHHPVDDLNQSTAEMKTNSSNRRLSKTNKFRYFYWKKRINHSSSSSPSDN